MRLAVLALVVTLTKAPEFFFPMGHGDAGWYAYIGQRILQGDVPYRDLWDNHPPGIYYVNGLIFLLLPESPLSLHIFELFYSLLTTFAMYRLGRLVYSEKTAYLVALLFGFFANLSLINEGGNLTETYMLLPMILAYDAFVRFRMTGNNAHLVLSGAMGAVAFLFKQPGIAGLAAICVLLGFERQGGWRNS